MSISQSDLFIVYGQKIAAMARLLIDSIDLEHAVLEKTASSGKGHGVRIALKPNLVVASPASTGATTHPELVGAVIDYLKQHGFTNLAIVESAWIGDSTTRAYKVCGYEALSSRTGVPLIDVKKDLVVPHKAGGITIEMSRQIMETDYLISFPVLKGHCQTNLTCALKNMKGCISDQSKRQFHSLGLHRPIALLNSVRKADLVIVDGICGDLDFEEGGNPVAMNRLIAARDSVLIDRYAADLLGFAPEEVPYIGLAEKLGVGSADLAKANIVELNENHFEGKPTSSRKVEGLARSVMPAEACSACYGSLIHALARLSEKGTDIRSLGKLYIGQGFKGKCQPGIGIGSCTAGFGKSLRGCPPKAIDIMNFLEENLP